MADKDYDTGSAKADATAKSSEYRRDNYERSWEGRDPAVRKKNEERVRGTLGKHHGKHFPNFDGEMPSSVYPDPVPSPLIRIFAQGGKVPTNNRLGFATPGKYTKGK